MRKKFWQASSGPDIRHRRIARERKEAKKKEDEAVGVVGPAKSSLRSLLPSALAAPFGPKFDSDRGSRFERSARASENSSINDSDDYRQPSIRKPECFSRGFISEKVMSVIPEPFVDADRAAEFLSVSRRKLLDLVRAGKIPAHKLGHKTWCFRLSEISLAVVRK